MKIADLEEGMMLKIGKHRIAFVRYIRTDDSMKEIEKFPWLSIHRESDFWRQNSRGGSPINNLPILYLGSKIYDNFVMGVKKRHSILVGDAKVYLFGHDLRHLEPVRD